MKELQFRGASEDDQGLRFLSATDMHACMPASTLHVVPHIYVTLMRMVKYHTYMLAQLR